ncbi:MAG: hypothetical protein IJI19_06060 [Ruminococcus sp.]|nr:hypothetical protein [Ruminococcus sp.]
MNVFELFAKLSLDSKDYEKGLDDGEKKGKSFSDKLKSGFSTATKVAAGAVGVVSTAVIAAGTAMVKQTGQVAEYGDHIDKMSQKLGLSAEAYQQWDYVLGQAGTDINSMSTGMKTLTNKLDDAKNGSQSAQDMFAKLGLSLEDLQGMSREDAFEAVIYGFQGMADSTERAALANDLFGKSGQELTPLFNSSIEETQELLQASKDLGFVMSNDSVKAAADYQDALDTMKRTMKGAKTSLISGFMPSITQVMDGLTQIFGGDSSKGVRLITGGITSLINNIKKSAPQMISAGRSILTALYDAIITNLPQLARGGTELIIGLVKGVVTALPQLIPAAITMIQTIVTTIWEHLPELWNAGKEAITQLVGGMDPADLITKAGDLLTNFISAVLDYLPKLLEKGKNLVQKMADGVTNNAPKIIKSITTVLQNLIKTILQKLPQFLAKGAELIVQMAKGLAQAAPTIIKSLGQMLLSLVKTIISNLPQFLAKGREIVAKMLSGLVGAQGTLISGLGSLLSKLVSAIANKLGQFLTKGREIVSKIASGITGAVSAVVSAIGSLISRAISAITGRSGQFKSQGSSIVSKIASGISGAVGKVTSAVSGIISRIKSAFSINWSGIGSNIISGVKSGISGAASGLASRAASAARSALNAMKNTLGIASPSKVARDEVGKNIALGIGEGFERYMPTDAMVGNVKDAFGVIARMDAPTISSMATVNGGGYEPLLRDIITALHGLIGMGVYIDGKALVGQLVASIDTALGQRVNYKERGIA